MNYFKGYKKIVPSGSELFFVYRVSKNYFLDFFSAASRDSLRAARLSISPRVVFSTAGAAGTSSFLAAFLAAFLGASATSAAF